MAFNTNPYISRQRWASTTYNDLLKITPHVFFVIDLNDFSVGDQAYDVRKGESAVLRCQAPDSFPHRTIQWSKITAGIETTLVKSSHYVVSKEGDLHFAFADKMDEGVYVCTVTNLFLSLPDQRKRRTINFGVLQGKYNAPCINGHIFKRVE